MNITFMIGNGFDLNLGLKTKFTDFYDTYFKSELDRDAPESVKNFIKLVLNDKETFGNLDKWSDFEMAFAENFEGTVEEVGEVLEDFTVQFAEYIRKEEEKCDYSDENVIGLFTDFLCLSYNFLKMRDKQLFKDILSKKGNEFWSIRCINFNYTFTFDTMFKKINDSTDRPFEVSDLENNKITYSLNYKKPILHIHGDLNSNIVIGVDSESQFIHKITGSEEELNDFAVKKEINFYSDSQRENNYRVIVLDSDIILMYGLSLGETDKSRWEIINSWLKVSPMKKLIYFAYQTNIKQIRKEYSPKLLMEMKKIKKDVLSKLGFTDDEYEKYYDQVFIIDSSDVLNFKLVDG